MSVPYQPLGTVPGRPDIVPLAGPSHLHIHSDGYHMTDNLSGGAKVYYDISPDGSITGMQLKAGGHRRINL